MSSGSLRRTLTCAALGIRLVVLTPGSAPAHTTQTRFYVPPPHKEAVEQALQLLRQHNVRDALLIGALEAKPHAVWVTRGTPDEARAAVRQTVRGAQLQHAVPVLVAYNIPGRDCGGCRPAAR